MTIKSIKPIENSCEYSEYSTDCCRSRLNCCDCGERENYYGCCGCRYCWSCNACDSCYNDE